MAVHPLLRAAAAVALVLAPLGTARGQATFDNAVFYGAGASPVSVEAGDLDGDQDADLAVVNIGGHLQILFNNGNGTFQTAVPHSNLWPSDSYTADLKMADLDRDGDNDLAVAFTTFTGAMSILLNHGNGTFAAPVNFDSCYSTQGITVGDFNGDLHRDVAGMSNCFMASVMLNDGSGTLVKRGDFGRGYVPGGIDSADLDGDRDRDIVYSNGTSDLTVLFNDGTGGFDVFTQMEAHDNPQWIVLADYDGDSDNDIAVANWYTNDIGIFRNDGSGGFGTVTKFGAGSNATGLAGADLDNDGDVDLVTANNGSDNATFRWNAGNATFPTQTPKAAGDGPQDVVIADLNGDARLDVVVASGNSNNVAVLINRLSAPPDADTDGITDASDCAPSNAAAWKLPSAAADLGLDGATSTGLSWSAPAVAGASTLRYDVLRSSAPSSFGAASCVGTDLTQRVATDTALPSPSAGFFYLVRVENACGGNLGAGTDGIPRAGAACP
jgi:hypothetical protein